MRVSVVTDERHCRVPDGTLYSSTGRDWRVPADLLGDVASLTLYCRVWEAHAPPTGWTPVTVDRRIVVSRLPWFTKYEGLLRLPVAYALFQRELRETEVVLLMVPNIYSVVAYRAARAGGLPVVTWCLGDVEESLTLVYDELPLRLIRGVYGRVTRHIVQKSDVAILTSRALSEKYEVGKKGLVVYRFSRDPRYLELETVRVLHQPRQILFVGRLSAEKGVSTLLEAMKLVKRALPGAHLTVAGDGPLRISLEAYVRTQDLGAVVSFPGWVSQGAALRRLYHGADIFCMPSYTEGMPAALQEALWASLPAVVTSEGDMPALVEGGDAGRVVPSRDPQALADSLIFLLTHPDVWTRMSQNAHRVAEHTSFARQSERVLLLMRQLAAP